MAFLDSSSSIITATLTERGRQLLATDPSKFKISKFSVSDDEIDYTKTETEIESLRLLEPITREHAIQFKAITLPKGSKYVGSLQLSNNELTIAGIGTAQCVINTINMTDNEGYSIFIDSADVEINAVDIISEELAQNLISLSDANTQSIVCKTTFSIKGKNVAGDYYVRIIGNNSGASAKLHITVTYVDYSQFSQV